MGGVLILGALITSTLFWARLDIGYVWLVLFVTMSFGVIGFTDDYQKVTRNSHAGVSGRVRLAIGFAIAAIAAFWATWLHPDAFAEPACPAGGQHVVEPWYPVHSLCNGGDRRCRKRGEPDRRIGWPGDHAGDDRRGSLGVIAYAVGRTDFTEYLGINYVPGTGEILIFAAGLIGGGLGFLWYNAPPAAVFMGDTGSLALGGGLGAIAVATKHEIVLAIIGGLFVVEALSVIIQVAYFKLTGKRVFLMAPIHHHFEKLGWAEPQIVIRFWIISLILALIGLATLKIR